MKIVNIIVISLFLYYLYDSLLKKNGISIDKSKNTKDTKEDFRLFCDQDIENTNFIKDYLSKINSADKIPQLKYPDFNIPYNFTDNLDHSVLYNNGIKGLKKRLKYEKQLVGGVKPNNFKLLKNNFNRNMEPFKKMPNYYYYYKNKDKCLKPMIEEDILECRDNYNKQFKLQLLCRWLSEENKIYINWSVPICHEISSILIYYKLLGDSDQCATTDDLDLRTFIKYEIPYQRKTTKETLEDGIYQQYFNLDRLACNFTTNELSKDNKYLFYVGLRFPKNKKISNLVEI